MSESTLSIQSEDNGAPNGLFHKVVYLSATQPRSLWPTCKHIFYIIKDKAYSLLIAPTGEPCVCIGYHKQGEVTQDLFLRFLFEKEAHLTQPYLEYEVVLGQVPFLLIPAELRDEAYDMALTRLLIDEDLLQEELMETQLSNPDLHILWGVNSQMRYLLDFYLRDYQMRPLCELNLSLLPQLEASKEGNVVLLTRLPGRVEIAVYQAGQLQLCNAYAASAPMEELYYLQSVLEVIGLKSEEVACYVQGEADPSGEEADSLWSRWSWLKLPSYPSLSDEIEADQYWRYWFLATG